MMYFPTFKALPTSFVILIHGLFGRSEKWSLPLGFFITNRQEFTNVCYGLCFCVPHKFMCWSSYPQDDGIWSGGAFGRWSDGEVMPPWMDPCSETGEQWILPPSYEDIARKWPFASQEESSPENPTRPVPWSLPAPRTGRNKCLLLKLPHSWDSVPTAGTGL